MSIQSVEPRRHHVVVIGSGFGGLFATKALARADVDVTVVARTTHHLFQPLLYQVATGILSVGDIAPPTRLVLRKQKNAQVLLGDVESIDLARQTVTSRFLERETVTPFDSLIVAAGAGQSYFGNDHFAEFAPGMKTIDDALELRGRILGAFEQAELSEDPAEQRRLLTFVVVGAGPTGVELAGQIAELSHHTLRGAFRNIDPAAARVVLLDGAPDVLPVYGGKLSAKARQTLEKLGVEIQLNAMVTDVDATGLTVKDKDGTERRIESQCKVWSAGVSASPLGRRLAEQSGAEVDRAGRVLVNPDLSLPGHPNVFVIGDMMALDKLPGLAQVAMQGGKYAARQIVAGLAGHSPAERKPFKYFDKGSMATISRFSAVAKVGKLEISGFVGWVAWLGIHLLYLVGFSSKLSTLLSWATTFLTRGRNEMASTEQQVFARNAIDRLQRHTEEAERGSRGRRAAG
ncbi:MULTISPECIES: NAD(P)/FAD-dependent oxidoreductase [Rhodococcus]|uniref:NADH:ubiquinone reductase (non-electrogenic) n=1 Tax=Rhodococcus indonesiensis TaxID=3055869 RepID=A0ABT7RVB4_9NOCA|nr:MULTISPECIES: NAD(P)/FAD-dependent oxidoreductase [Rhodococcus]MDM7491582.1 NAD(P)/FAD-dependent oxidoreductase [Rhodococcus indonesiensis]